jgi:O-methyltransferase
MIPEELDAYREIARKVTVEGDIVECGVYMGTSLAAIAETLPGRRAWAYDSFQGFPPGDPEHDDPVACGLVGAVKGDPEAVRSLVEPFASEVVIREGWFEDTLALGQVLPARIAFLSVDCDLYASVFKVLRMLSPRVVRGGIVTVDDYTTFVGAQKACVEWARVIGITVVPEFFGPTRAAWWRM